MLNYQRVSHCPHDFVPEILPFCGSDLRWGPKKNIPAKRSINIIHKPSILIIESPMFGKILMSAGEPAVFAHKITIFAGEFQLFGHEIIIFASKGP